MESIWNFICENASLGNISQLAVIISALFVAYQAYLFRKDYQSRNEHSAFNISYQLARYYADNILPRMGAANNIIQDICKRSVPAETFKEKIVDFSAFTEPEATTLFSRNAIDKFHDDYRHCVDEDMLAHFFSIYHGIPYLEIKKEWEQTLSTANPDEREQFYKDMSLLMQRNIADVFNHLEFLSMYFHSGLADSDTVYVSLHQTFLDFIASSYLYIAARNKSPKHAFFTHIIALYKKWHDKSERDTNEEQSNIKHADILTHQAEHMQNEARKLKEQPQEPKKLRHQ